jgi:uncharacterized membrane protein YgcG
MLGKIGLWRHAVAAGTIGGTAVLAATGVIGRGNYPERFESKVVTVTPVGDDGVRIREVVDQDFGTHDRHGYERIVTTDFGNPIDIEASSPDASAEISVTGVDTGDRIRLGDRDVTMDGQHRYVLSYTLPQARLSTGQLALDIIGDPRKPEEFETGRFEVVVAGLALDNPTCVTGVPGSSTDCKLSRDGDVYRAVVSPLKPGEGITIGGTITGRTSVATPIDPVVPTRRTENRAALALTAIPLGLLGAGGVYVASRRAGRNEVFAGGAADAAYGSLPTPTADAAQAVDVRKVADSKMDELATIEFVPPKGIAPWQGAMLLNERVDQGTIGAWISGLVAKEGLTLTQQDGHLVIGRGSQLDTFDSQHKALVNQLLDNEQSLSLGAYNANFGMAWNQIAMIERQAITASGWWKRPPPGAVNNSAASVKRWLPITIFAFIFFCGSSVVTAGLGLFHGKASALVFAVAVPAISALFLYKRLLPARSATGSALALRTESFRRFLAASEGKHVDWAWKQGLLREYSAWAVALGAADAWGKALAASNVPAPDLYQASPMWVYSMGSSFNSTRSAPAPTGGSSGGFGGGSSSFSGGSVGGGGGGGSSGSW